MSADTKPCPKCQGLGEVIARSRSVGNGAVNDDWDTCTACDGSGTLRAEQPEPMTSAERRTAISVALDHALITAVFAKLKGHPLAGSDLEIVRKALLAHGHTLEHIRGCEQAIEEGWLEGQRPWALDPANLSPLEVEALR